MSDDQVPTPEQQSRESAWAAAVTGDASAEQHALVERLIADQPERAIQLQRDCAVEALLRNLTGDPRDLAASVRESINTHPSQRLHKNVMRRIRKRRARQRGQQWWITGAGLAAAAAMILMIWSINRSAPAPAVDPGDNESSPPIAVNLPPVVSPAPAAPPLTVVAQRGPRTVPESGLQFDMQLHLPESAELELAHHDGSRLSLSGPVLARVPPMDDPHVLLVEEGQVDCVVEPQVEATLFAIHTPRSSITAHGTVFSVNTQAHYDEVRCHDGHVRVKRHHDDAQVEVHAGNQLMFTSLEALEPLTTGPGGADVLMLTREREAATSELALANGLRERGYTVSLLGGPDFAKRAWQQQTFDVLLVPSSLRTGSCESGFVGMESIPIVNLDPAACRFIGLADRREEEWLIAPIGPIAGVRNELVPAIWQAFFADNADLAQGATRLDWLEPVTNAVVVARHANSGRAAVVCSAPSALARRIFLPLVVDEDIDDIGFTSQGWDLLTLSIKWVSKSP